MCVVGSCCGARAPGVSVVCVVRSVKKWGPSCARVCSVQTAFCTGKVCCVCVLCRGLGVTGFTSCAAGLESGGVMSLCGGQGKGLCSVYTSATPTRLGRSWFQCRDGGTVPYMDGAGGQQKQISKQQTGWCRGASPIPGACLYEHLNPAQLRPRNFGQQLWAGGGWWWFTYTCCPLATMFGAWLFMGHRL
jgi:hypothetical protein